VPEVTTELLGDLYARISGGLSVPSAGTVGGYEAQCGGS
jgi:hypothetical protein